MASKKALAWLAAVTMLSVSGTASAFADNSAETKTAAAGSISVVELQQENSTDDTAADNPTDTEEDTENDSGETSEGNEGDSGDGSEDDEDENLVTTLDKVTIKTGFSYTTESVTIRWEPVKGATGYVIDRFDISTSKWEIIDTVGDVSSYTESGLEAGTSYAYAIRAICENSNGSVIYGSRSNLLYAFTKCEAAQVNSSYTSKSNYITFSWESVKGASGYKLYRYNSKTKNWDRIATISNSNTLTYTDSKLSANTHYMYKVQAYRDYNGANCHADMSQALSAFTAPESVTISSGFGYTTTSVTCRWSKSDGASGYEVYRYDVESKKWILLATTDSSTTSFTDSGLTAGESYRYIVRPFSVFNGVTSYGYFGSELNAFAKCDVTTIQSKYSSGNDYITINWSKVNGASGYKVYRYNSKTKNWDRVATLSGGDTLSYKDSNLQKNTSYKYKVQAYRNYNTAQCHGDMSEAATFSTSALSTPSISTGFSYTTTSITFRWSKVSDADGYIIYKYNSSTKNWDKLATISNASTVSYTEKGLVSGDVYKYKIQCYKKKSDGSFEYSSFSNVLTGFTKCETVKINSDYSSTSNSVTISWSKINGAHGYKVYRYNSKTGKWDRVANLWGSDITSYQDKNLTQGVTYQYKVHAYRQYNGAHCHGDLSAIKKVTVDPMTVKVKVNDKSTTSVSLKWNKYSGSGYYVYQKINGKYQIIATLKNADYTSYTVTGLTPGTRYYFAVRAFKTENGGTAMGCYGLSTAATFTYASSYSDASLADLDTIVTKAATLLGTPYDFGSKGYTNVYSLNNTSVKTVSEIRSGGIDCTGLIYYTLMQLGYKTSGFSWNNLVPVDTTHWLTRSGTCTITYNGKTTNVEVQKNAVSTDDMPYWQRKDGSTISPGTVVVADNDDGYNHGWIYIGEFASRDDVIWYLKSLGISESLITVKTVGDGKGTDGTHWRIESNGSDGVVVNNNTNEGSGKYISVFRITEP